MLAFGSLTKNFGNHDGVPLKDCGEDLVGCRWDSEVFPGIVALIHQF